jgi:hypothetical protein
MNSQQRDVVCKVQGADRNNIVLILYLKFSNNHPIEGPTNTIIDTAGFFTRQIDAQNVADCLNRLIPLNQINGKYRRVGDYVADRAYRLYTVRAWYESVGNFEPHEHTDDLIISVAKTKKQLNYREVKFFMENTHANFHIKGPFIKRYVVNDVMPTMHLDDYDLSKHKERLKTVLSSLTSVPWSKQSRQELRKASRAIPQHISYVDSSDSENESNYKKTSARSLKPMLTPLSRQSNRLERKRVQARIINPIPIRSTRSRVQSPRRSKRLKK